MQQQQQQFGAVGFLSVSVLSKIASFFIIAIAGLWRTQSGDLKKLEKCY